MADPNAPKPLVAQAALPAGYVLIQSIPVMRAKQQTGTLELIEDERLTPQRRQRLWGRAIDGAQPSADSMGTPVKQDDLMRDTLLASRLRLIRVKNVVATEMILPTPLAGLEPVRLYDDDTETYLVTEDRSSRDLGKLVTIPIEIADDQFRRVSFLSNATGKLSAMELIGTRHAAWRLVPARDTDGKEIETIACHARDDQSAEARILGEATATSELTYASYVYDGKLWHQATKRNPGCWEDDDDFPPQPEFP